MSAGSDAPPHAPVVLVEVDVLVDVDATHVLQRTLHSSLKLVPRPGCWHMRTLRSPKMKQSAGSTIPLHVPAVVGGGAAVGAAVGDAVPHVLHIAGHSEWRRSRITLIELAQYS